MKIVFPGDKLGFVISVRLILIISLMILKVLIGACFIVWKMSI